jgi:DNA-binding NarL/FixJ family response regulator
MPRLTAYSVLEQLLEIDPDVHVLFSGDFFTEDLTASEWHTLGVITKPYRPDELIEMVRRALARHAEK